MTRWGSWEFDRRTLVLRHVGGYGYEVDLERCNTPAEVLDWIAQIEGKTWGTPVVVGELVAAICDLLNPQATLCSWGVAKTITPKRMRRLLLDNERRVLALRSAGALAEPASLDRLPAASGYSECVTR
jgi:hypothetical protein